MKIQLTDEQLDWLVARMTRRYTDKTVEMLRLHYVNGVPRNDLAEKYQLTRSLISQTFGHFEKELETVLEEHGIRTSVIFHDLLDTAKLRQYDIAAKDKKQ